MKELQETLQKLIPLLNELGVRYHLTGGLAVSYHGEPRLTQDIDLVLELFSDPQIIENVFQALSSNFQLEKNAFDKALQTRAMFQILEEENLVKIDIHVGEAVPDELKRSKQVEILPNIFVPLVSREDAIVSKLIWINNGSQKSIQDLKMLMQRTPAPNYELINELVETLGLTELWQRLRDSEQS